MSITSVFGEQVPFPVVLNDKLNFLAKISSFEGIVSVWVDGKRLMEYTDPMPVPPGTIGLEFWLKGANATIYIDDMSVCELSAPFVSIVPVEE